MKNKAKPDDRRDNVEKLQINISNTIDNYRETKEVISKTEDEKEKKDLIEKNKRRKESLEGLRNEIRDEAIARENSYK